MNHIFSLSDEDDPTDDSSPTVKKDKRESLHPQGQMFTVNNQQRSLDLGSMPHEILLSVAQGKPYATLVWQDHGVDPAAGGEWVTRYIEPTIDQRIDAAKSIAPYYARKLAPVQTELESNQKLVQVLTGLFDRLPT